MKYKKFLLIPVLIVAYIFFLPVLIESLLYASLPAEGGEAGSSGAMMDIGASAIS